MGGDFTPSQESFGNNFLHAEQNGTLLPMNQVISKRDGRDIYEAGTGPGMRGLSAPGQEMK